MTSDLYTPYEPARGSYGVRLFPDIVIDVEKESDGMRTLTSKCLFISEDNDESYLLRRSEESAPSILLEVPKRLNVSSRDFLRANLMTPLKGIVSLKEAISELELLERRAKKLVELGYIGRFREYDDGLEIEYKLFVKNFTDIEKTIETFGLLS